MSLGTFTTSKPLTLGVELELQIVGTHDYDLSPAAADLLRVLGKPDSRRKASTELGTFIDLRWPGISVRRWDGAGGRVVNIAVTDRGIRTDNGIGVGTPLSRVRSAYPKATCEASPVLCMIGDPVPGNTVTTFRFTSSGRVSEVSVGRVID